MDFSFDVCTRIAAGRVGVQADGAVIGKSAGSVNPWVAAGATEPGLPTSLPRTHSGLKFKVMDTSRY
jgi:hypothetical protein